MRISEEFRLLAGEVAAWAAAGTEGSPSPVDGARLESGSPRKGAGGSNPSPSANECKCDLCGRAVPRTTRHHLIPRKVARRAWVKKARSPEEILAKAALCDDCHVEVHRLVDETRLAREGWKLDMLRSIPEVAKYLRWVRKRPPGVAASNGR